MSDDLKATQLPNTSVVLFGKWLFNHSLSLKVKCQVSRPVANTIFTDSSLQRFQALHIYLRNEILILFNLIYVNK